MSLKSLEFLKMYFSPFKRPKISFYIGKVNIGTPYFYPRKWVAFTKEDALEKAKRVVLNENSVYFGKDPNNLVGDFMCYTKTIPKKIGFDFVPLGWKTKYDYIRFEYNPVWSFVFFKWQIALTFYHEYCDHTWECWLYYYTRTDKTKSVKERIKQARKMYSCIWTSVENGVQTKTCYWDLILKEKYL